MLHDDLQTKIVIKDGNILIVKGRFANSQEDCCCTCLVGPPWNDECSCLDFDDTYITKKMGPFPGIAPGPPPPVPPTLSIQCGPYGPDCEVGWLIQYEGTYDDPENEPNALGSWSLFISNLNCGCCPDLGSYNMTLDNWQLDGGGEPSIPAPTITLTFYNPSALCDDAKCTPISWQLYDTDNGKVLDYGDISKDNETTYTLDNLGDEFIPWGYWSKNFHVELRIFCVDDLVGEKIWETNVEIGKCGNNRYPAYPYDAPWTRKICKPRGHPCLHEEGDVITINMSPGAKTRDGNVNTYVGTVPNNYDYSNIFNWTGGTYNIDLPDDSIDVSILAQCLEDGSGAAVCNNLTISGNFKFGIAITASGRVLVENGAHVIDEKYNTICTDLPVGRGHITCSGAGDVSTSLVGYQYNGAVIFDSLSILSGTVTYSGSHNVAVTFDDSAYISDNGTITGGDHIFFSGANVAKFNDPLSLDVPTPTYNGKWIFFGNSQNRGGLIVTPQYVEFYASGSTSYGKNTSGVQAGRITTANFPVKFYGSSNGKECPDGSRLSPDGIVTHDAEFYSYGGVDGYNAGKVEGDADFYDNSYNTECANDIDGQATFWDTSCNRDIITGDPIFNDNSSNGCPGWLNNTAVKIIGNPTFNDTAHNISKIEGNPIFNEDSYNDTSGVITGDPTFNNNAYSTGTINGTPKFYDDSSTFGTITSTSGTVNFYNRASIQNGTVNGNCSFVNNSFLWKGTVNGDCSFADYAGCGAYFPPPSGPWLYNGGGGVCVAIVNGNTTFANNTLNNGCIRVPDNGSCVFSDSSANNGGYITKADGASGSNNSLYSVIFNDTSRNGVSRTTDVYGGNVTFNSGTGNGYAGVNANVNAYNVVFNGTGSIGSVQNYGYVTGSNSVSMTYGYNNNGASITGPTTLTNSENSTLATITGNTSFISSKNYGTVTGDADFDSTSCNSGTVTGTITGNPPAC